MSLAVDDVLIESLISIAEGSDADSAAKIAELGAERTAEAVLSEVASRARLLTEPTDKVPVQFDLGFAGDRFGYVLTVGAGVCEVEKNWQADTPVIVRQDLVEFLRDVYGPAGPHDATREVAIPHPPTSPSFDPEDPLNKLRSYAVVAAHQVVGALTRRPTDLGELAVRFDSDKWGDHWYTRNYERYFEPFRTRRVKILELGIGGYFLPDQGGASLKMWKHYFHRGLVYGLDIYDKTGLAEPRIKTIQGNQGDVAFLDSLGSTDGPFDIVVDDGSHHSSDVLASFTALFPHVRPGGLYVIEDLCTSYWPGWGGSSDDLGDPQTSMGFLKTLLDGLNHQEQVRAGEYEPSALERTVTGVHLHHNMAIIEKGLNTEAGAPSWISRTEDPMGWINKQQ